jgi:hypothetical protein
VKTIPECNTFAKENPALINGRNPFTAVATDTAVSGVET